MAKTKKTKLPVKKATTRKKKPKEPKVGEYNGIEYESYCELSLLFFAEELKKAGYVDKVVRSPSYVLADAVVNTYLEEMKRGSKTAQQTIQNSCSYTPDFDIYFNESAVGRFIWVLGSTVKWDKKMLIAQKVGNQYRVCCEVKPDFSRASTTPKSVQSMKWCYQTNGVFVNLFRPNNIFEKLFTPKKYLTTESGGLRKLKFTPISIEVYLKRTKNENTNIKHHTSKG